MAKVVRKTQKSKTNEQTYRETYRETLVLLTIRRFCNLV